MKDDIAHPDIDLTWLCTMANGPILSKLLRTGLQLSVFDYLGEPQSAPEVAQMAECHPESMRLLLDGLTAGGLLTKHQGLYRNTPEAQTTLIQGAPTYMGDFFTMMLQMQEASLANMLEIMRQGPPRLAGQGDVESEETWAGYAASIANYQRAGFARLAARIVSALPEFPLFRRMLDLGGGPGIVGLAIVEAHPSMTGVVFDMPSVVRVADGFIRQYGMEDRISVMGGDYMQDPFGEGYDLVWASSTLNFAGQNLDGLLGKIFDALNPGGVFVSLADGLTHERTRPETLVVNNFPYALMGQEFGMERGVIAESMRVAGFSSVVSRTVDTPMMPLDLDVARKGA